MIFRRVEAIEGGMRDTLNMLGRLLADVNKLHAEVRAQRVTLDQLLLQQQKQGEQQAAGLVALLQAEVETEDERVQREKLEQEFEEFQMVMKRLEEV